MFFWISTTHLFIGILFLAGNIKSVDVKIFLNLQTLLTTKTLSNSIHFWQSLTVGSFLSINESMTVKVELNEQKNKPNYFMPTISCLSFSPQHSAKFAIELYKELANHYAQNSEIDEDLDLKITGICHGGNLGIIFTEVARAAQTKEGEPGTKNLNPEIIKALPELRMAGKKIVINSISLLTISTAVTPENNRIVQQNVNSDMPIYHIHTFSEGDRLVPFGSCTSNYCGPMGNKFEQPKHTGRLLQLKTRLNEHGKPYGHEDARMKSLSFFKKEKYDFAQICKDKMPSLEAQFETIRSEILEIESNIEDCKNRIKAGDQKGTQEKEGLEKTLKSRSKAKQIPFLALEHSNAKYSESFFWKKNFVTPTLICLGIGYKFRIALTKQLKRLHKKMSCSPQKLHKKSQHEIKDYSNQNHYTSIDEKTKTHKKPAAIKAHY